MIYEVYAGVLAIEHNRLQRFFYIPTILHHICIFMVLHIIRGRNSLREVRSKVVQLFASIFLGRMQTHGPKILLHRRTTNSEIGQRYRFWRYDTLCYISGVFVLDSVQTTAPSTGHVRHQLPDEPRCPPHFTPTLTLQTVNHARATHSHRTCIASPCHNPQPPDVALAGIPSRLSAALLIVVAFQSLKLSLQTGWSETVTIPPHP